jgi:hypothetical protein
MWLSFAFVMIAMAVSDFVWAQCIIATTNGLALRAALTSSSMILINSVVVLIYVNNHWTILAATAGSCVGTYFSVKRFSSKRKEDGRQA